MLLKGVSKRVIIIKNPESEIFEEAYFIVKNKSIFNQAKENEMVLEANRIISDYSRQQKIAAGEIKNKSEKKLSDTLPDFGDDEFFEDAKFFAGNNFGENFGEKDNLSKFSYPVQSQGFKLISAKKISKFKLPEIKAPPRSFFIGIGVMSAIIIAARILEFILSG